MEAKELRIGNYVESSIIEIGMLKVLAITTARDTNYINACDIKFIEPIPLTEEWLLKFGFRFTSISDTYFKNTDDNLKQVNIHHKPFMLYSFNCSTKLEYVHQLQNLYFALTGEELTIKN